MLVIDGSEGEGGGQVLRTCLALAALTGRSFRLENIRAARSRPGLRPQHLTAVRAAAAICAAALRGAELDSTILEFRPQAPPRAGDYTFDVREAAPGGSAGSVTLIFQTLLWPLLFAGAPSTVTLRGGTFVPFSPPFHYLAHVFKPACAHLGARFALELQAWGWYPAGEGAMRGTIEPIAGLEAAAFPPPTWKAIEGIAAATNLPAHIPQRMSGRATNLLADLGLQAQVRPLRARAAHPGAGIVLWAPGAGFSSLGRPGLPAESVAEEAVAQCRAFRDNKASVDRHLADQLLLPLALARGQSSFTTSELTSHTFTNAALLRRWLDALLEIGGALGEAGQIAIRGVGWASDQPAYQL